MSIMSDIKELVLALETIKDIKHRLVVAENAINELKMEVSYLRGSQEAVVLKAKEAAASAATSVLNGKLSQPDRID